MKEDQQYSRAPLPWDQPTLQVRGGKTLLG